MHCRLLQYILSCEEDGEHVSGRPAMDNQICIHWVWPTQKIVSDACTNFVSEEFKDFCRCLNIDQAMRSLYHHQSIGQVEACIKFVKGMIKKCRQTNNEASFALIQIWSTPTGAGIPSPATLLLNRPIRTLLSQVSRE